MSSRNDLTVVNPHACVFDNFNRDRRWYSDIVRVAASHRHGVVEGDVGRITKGSFSEGQKRAFIIPNVVSLENLSLEAEKILCHFVVYVAVPLHGHLVEHFVRLAQRREPMGLETRCAALVCIGDLRLADISALSFGRLWLPI